MNSHSLLSINDGGNTCCSSSSLSPLQNFLNLHPTDTTTTRSFQLNPSHFSRSSTFCNLSSSSSSDTQKHLGTALPFLPNPSTERSPPPAAASFTEEDLLLSIPYEEVEVDTSFLSLSGDGGGFQDLDNFDLSEEQIELQFLSDELELAITDRAQTPRLDEIYQVTGSSPGQNCVPAAMPVLSPGGSAAVNQKPRMRWSPKLHDCFLEAVKKLDGPEKATPKAVMKMMNVEGLTIYQVKSHLQKYRLAKHMPERKEEKKTGSNSEDKKPASNTSESNGRKKGAMQLTEALRMQMEVQKQLHQQLEVQRSLQLRIEEQAKYLEKILDEQRKAATTTSKQQSQLSSSSSSAKDDECETSPKRQRLERTEPPTS